MNSWIDHLNADYSAVTGLAVKNFVCPITLEDSPDVEMCDGHILNKSIKGASRQTVPQRKDVDNYFGHTIEPDLVKYLNLPHLTREELTRKSDRLNITLPSGDKIETFFANSKAGEKFQRVDLLGPDGKPFASPFLRSEVNQAGVHHDSEVEWVMFVNDIAMVGALLKSAYLALFKVLGYRYALSLSGDKVRRTLHAFYKERADAKDAEKFFGEFTGCNMVSLSESITGGPDTIEDGAIVMHYAQGDVNSGILFAATCLFRIDSAMIAVTVPSHQHDHDYLTAYKYYTSLIRDRNMNHIAHRAQFQDGRVLIEASPMELKYVDKAL